MPYARDYKKLDKKEVEDRVRSLIARLGVTEHLSVEWLKDYIYNFDLPDARVSSDYFGKVLYMFPKDLPEDDLNDVVMVLNDAWNCFPQKVLDGKSPQEKFYEEEAFAERDSKYKMSGKIPLTKEEELMREHFENAKAGLDDYLHWAFKEVLPNYIKYCEAKDKKTAELAWGIAEIFLEACGQSGFFEFGRIHPGFIDEFPDNFLFSITGPKLTRGDIKGHLDDFFSFLDVYYPANAIRH